MKRLLLIIGIFASVGLRAQQGLYFDKKQFDSVQLPDFETVREELPQPIYAENPLWVETYWKAWEIAFRNFYAPTPQNGFVSWYIDSAFNNCIFLWDTSFMTMFCNYAHPLVPGISSLDNFYCKQYPNGEICREISREDGKDCPFWVNQAKEPLYSSWGYDVPDNIGKVEVKYVGREAPQEPSRLTLDGMNHPIMAWAEMESYRLTGDRKRLEMVYEPLKRQYEALKIYLQQGNGLYMTDWASMDNSARNKYLRGGGTGIDISSEMVLLARNLKEMAALTGHRKEVTGYEVEATALAQRINNLMWNAADGFYYDLTLDGKQVGIKTVAAYWTLLAGVATPERAVALADRLVDSTAFGRRNLVPTLAADEAKYDFRGNYWCGSVWAPTTTMVVEGLERYGMDSLARRIALNHVALVADVYRRTGTIWENYAPDAATPGVHADGKPVAKDFVGWSGIGPIKFFIEYALGLRADAERNRVTWTIASEQAVGCKNFRFNGNVISLEVDFSLRKDEIKIMAEKPFTLCVRYGDKEYTWRVGRGSRTLRLNE